MAPTVARGEVTELALESFRVANQKSLVLAECTSVPSLMVVTGPNGVGKSSLLYALKRREGTVYTPPDTQVLYQPPHRAIRRQQVRRRWVQTQMRGFTELLAGDDVGGFEGLNIQFPQRAPDNVDESGSTLKYSLGRVENRRQGVLASLVDAARADGRPLDTTALPDVYGPLKRLVSTLVPHLDFRGISFDNEDDIRLTFRVGADSAASDIDLNDLSSGEKAILLLFMPLVESEIDGLLRSLGGLVAEPNAPMSRVMLIDEPEQHLHPELQGRVLAYLRSEAATTGLQAILATHSPALLDLATDTELYVLRRPDGDRNQLHRVADSKERLDALRELVGNPYVVTTGRTVVLVEGPPGGGGNTDVHLLDRIHPSATRYTFVPMGGRGTVVSAVRGLRREVSEARFGINVLGIVDRDRGTDHEDGVVPWPFTMIENLLLGDSRAIARAVGEVSGGVTPSTRQVDEALASAASSLREDEIRIRVQDYLGPRTIRVGGTSLSQVRDDFAAAVAGLHSAYGDDARVSDVVARAANEVDSALADGSYRTAFRGKQLLHRLFDMLGVHNVPFGTFQYALANACAKSDTVQAQVREVFEALDAARAARIEAIAAEQRSIALDSAGVAQLTRGE